MNINGKTIAAYILLVIDVAFFFWPDKWSPNTTQRIMVHFLRYLKE